MTTETELIPVAELIVIKTKLPVLTANFAKVKKWLEGELKKYDIVVTIDTVKGAKELSTDINKFAAEIDRRRKEEVAAASAPIRDFDDKMKELVTMCKDGRQKLISQVTIFEDETRKKCRGLLSDALGRLWGEYQVKVEFYKAGFDDLILISNVTATGSLTKTAMDKLTGRVKDDKALQDRTERRLLELENRCYKAGLAAPLSRQHVESFLFDSDDMYAQRLQRLLDVEIERQKEAERRILAQAEQKRKQEEAAKIAEDERQQRLSEQRPAATPTIPAHVGPPPAAEPIPAHKGEPPRLVPLAPAPTDKALYDVTARFEILVPAYVDPGMIESKVRTMLDKAGFTTLAGLEVAQRVSD